VEVAGYLSVARRWWWTLLAATATAAIAAFVLVSQIAPTYEARTELLVGPYNSDTDTLGAAGRLVQTYAELVVTEPLLESAIAETGADVSVSALAARTQATANETTRFLTIQVQDTDPERARDLANALGDEIAQLASLDTSRPEGQIQVVDAARVPTDPIAPEVPLFVAMAALVALVGALVLMTLVEYLSPKVRTKEDLVRVSDVPFLGQLDTLRRLPASGAELVDRVPNSGAAAGYRMVAAKLAFDDAGGPIGSVLVVGTAADGARGQVATNLAAVVAHGGRRVVLIDADATDAPVTRLFDLEGRSGLADIAPGTERNAANHLVPIAGMLQIMPRGRSEPTEDDDAAHVSGTLAALARGTDLVVVSTGPLHLSASALQWARACEATMVVSVRDGSRREDVTYAVENLRLVGVEPRGAVLAVRRRSLGRRRADAPQPTLPAERVPDVALSVAPAASSSAPAAPEPEPPVTPAPRTPRTARSPRATRGRAPRASRGRGSAGETGA
jgi:succinoglycan biosynthesis transport protein ExoP